MNGLNTITVNFEDTSNNTAIPVEEVPLISVFIVCGHYGFSHPKIPSWSASFFSPFTFALHTVAILSKCIYSMLLEAKV